MKTTRLWTLIMLAAGAGLLVSCSELKKELAPPTSPAVGVHSEAWVDTTSSQFHGAVMKSSGFPTEECVKCHGGDFSGGTSGVSCYGCHALYPHDPEWMKADSDSSHAAYLKRAGYNTSSCVTCHGADLAGGSSGVSCNSCHALYPHPPGWTTPTDQGFHGVYLKNQSYNLTGCSSCHGSDFQGGSSGVSCYGCHASYPHLDAWTNVASGASHGHYLKAKDWADAECQSCHGATYAGGTSGVACFTCHASYPHSQAFPSGVDHPLYMRQNSFPLPACKTCHGQTYAGGAVLTEGCLESGCHVDANGTKKSPEACNTCHGSFRAPESDVFATAPPKSVAGETSTSVPAVGAHTAHLQYGRVLETVQCVECHNVPPAWNGSGHIDPAPAEIVFNGPLGRQVTGDGTNVPAPTYNGGTNGCAGTYCHGNFAVRRSTAPAEYAFAYADSVITGGFFAPVWTGGPAQTACGSTCHALPPKGHLASGPTCNGCHSGVVDANNNIIDATLHINGKVNVFATERPMH